MKILSNDKWSDGYLDYHRRDEDYRIRPLAWRVIDRITDMYFVRPRSAWLVYNYLREVGGREVLRKILSRSSERARNEKFISCGFGEVIEAGAGGDVRVGQHVVFIAPAHPACVERLVLPAELLLPARPDLVPGCREDLVQYLNDPLPEAERSLWAELAGWSSYSGATLTECLSGLLNTALRLVQCSDWNAACRFAIDATATPRERDDTGSNQRQGSRKTAVLVGYGNYAKTIILPNVRRFISVECVHEVDPTQMSRMRAASWHWDTADAPRPNTKYDAWLIAGFHHTHAPLAIKALRAGQYAVVEKPIATDVAECEELLATVEKCPRMFAGFHKRYSPMNEWALDDLKIRPGEPVSYHCIVYEVPLPHRHWYKWPRSRGRIVSNGCHWIDHFLFLNAYSPVVNVDIHEAPAGTASCFATLRNGACFTMVLTDEGSGRVGVRDYVELRANGITARMVDGSHYVAEDSRRILRRARLHKYSSFQRMYRSIGRAIAHGDNGDSVVSAASSTQLVLAFEEMVKNGAR